MAPGDVKMTFAEKQLAKYGWKKGMGLGKMNDGISEPIKVKTCKNNLGIGNDPKKPLSHWWDMAYNRAVNNIVVERSEKGTIEVKSSSKCSISQEKPNLFNTNVLYDDFQQAGSLKHIQFTSKRRAGSDSSDSEDEARGSSKGQGLLLDMTDAELLKLCGGGTAHKGARHGIRMGGKMKRLKAMEEADAARAAQQRLAVQATGAGDRDNRPEAGGNEGDVAEGKRKESSAYHKQWENNGDQENYLEAEVPGKKKKKSKKDKNKDCGIDETCVVPRTEIDGDKDSTPEINSDETNCKHSKKRKREDTAKMPVDVHEVSVEVPIVSHEKEKKKNRNNKDEDITEERKSSENNTDFSADFARKKKKKNRYLSSKTEQNSQENCNEIISKKKSRTGKVSDETAEGIDVEKSSEETTQKKKKRKKQIS